MRFRTLTACALAALTLSACAGASPAEVAATPEQAARAFDGSLRHSGQQRSNDYACPDAMIDGGIAISLDGGPTTTTARTVRAGDRWRVTLTLANDGNEFTTSVYEVRRQDGGYCVADQLNTPGVR